MPRGTLASVTHRLVEGSPLECAALDIPAAQIHDGLFSDRLERCEHPRVIKTRYRLETGIRSDEQPYPSVGVRGDVNRFHTRELLQLPLRFSSATRLRARNIAEDERVFSGSRLIALIDIHDEKRAV